VYVTRTHGGVGGGDREVFPYPDYGAFLHRPHLGNGVFRIETQSAETMNADFFRGL
jgi:hypothetical protein